MAETTDSRDIYGCEHGRGPGQLCPWCIGRRPVPAAPAAGQEGEDHTRSLPLADASRQIRENIEAVDFTKAPWEAGDYVICLCGKPVGDTLTPHDAGIILAWLKVAWKEMAESLLKVAPALGEQREPAERSGAEQDPYCASVCPTCNPSPAPPPADLREAVNRAFSAGIEFALAKPERDESWARRIKESIAGAVRGEKEGDGREDGKE